VYGNICGIFAVKACYPVKNDCAKLIVYDNENEQYYTLITPEAHSTIKEWIAYRESDGEKITPESYLIRDYGKPLIQLTKTTTKEEQLLDLQHTQRK
jgi:hypothetical protein